MNERALNDRELLGIAKSIEAISRQTGFERRTRIGQVLFEQVFSGDVEACVTPGAQRQVSFRKLADLLDGKMSKSELQRSLNVYLVCQKLPFVPMSGHLTVSHVDAVAGLDLETQERLLRVVEEQRLSVRQLRQLRRNTNASEMLGDPRRHLVSLARRASRRGRRTSEALSLLLRSIPRGLTDLPSDDVAELMRCVDTLECACAELRNSIRAREVSRAHAA